MSTSPLTLAAAEHWLSPNRFGIYSAAAGGDLNRAMALYEWNSRATAACLQDIGHLEVLIRNSYDARLLRNHSNWTDPADALWAAVSGIPQTRQRQKEANSRSIRSLRAAHNKRGGTHGHVVANLSFGFWAALTQPEREATIWTPILSPLFPGRARGPVHDSMGKLNSFRNRLAHWEPLFSRTTGLMRQLDLVDTLFHYLDTNVAHWVGERSEVLALMKSIPEPLLGAAPRSYLGVAP